MPDIPIAPLTPWQRRGTRVAFNENTAADHEVVAANAGKKVRVLGWSLVATAAVTLTWKSATTEIGGPFPFQSGGLWETPTNYFYLYETASGEALNLTLSGAVQVQGEVYYELVEVGS